MLLLLLYATTASNQTNLISWGTFYFRNLECEWVNEKTNMMVGNALVAPQQFRKVVNKSVNIIASVATTHQMSLVSLHVQREVVGARERSLTDLTFERLVSGVFAVVASKFIGACKPPRTSLPRTLIRLLTWRQTINEPPQTSLPRTLIRLLTWR